ncbi:hypothetical protein [Desulfonatronovibrio hydrogenovorans]|uniref:hypothetical protein n=1 Tax=Desulfonatronovibrio hydrogenovorans TaxID=53245 RepID=UPI00048E4A69|nr:hypothetical protein [Desulfonatronovibrio hydrogenovorans]
MNKDSLIIHFPFMHEDFVSEQLRSLALFLNPGLVEDTPNAFRPERLVLSPKEANFFLNQSIQFGEQFKKPSDMAYLGVKNNDDFYSDTSLALRWQISTYDQDKNHTQPSQELLQAQQMLILEYVFEERVADLRLLDRDLGETWKKFDQDLGIEREDGDFAYIDRDPVSGLSTSADWKKLLWAFAMLLPRSVFLLVHDPETASELEEAGLSWREVDHRDYYNPFPAGLQLFSGVLKSGQKTTHLSRLKNDLFFLHVKSGENQRAG